MINNKIAGLAMLRELDNMFYEVAEFYVCPKFRKDGNAIWFALQLAQLFDGQFTFSTRFTNPRAIKFWDKFAKLFEHNESLDDEIGRNWIIRKNNFKEHTVYLAPIYFELIKSGEKILEGRLNDEKRKNFNIGDKITFYKEPEKTAKVLKDGWFNTEDYGKVNEKGQLVINGRKKNVIVLTNGKNVYPEEIENYILRIPYVEETIVKSVKNDIGQEVALCAEVYLNSDKVKELEIKNVEEQLKKDISKETKELASYKHITKIEIRKTEFIKTTTKKIKR